MDAVVYRRGIRRDAGRRRPRGDDGHGDRFRTQLRQGAPEAGHDNRPPPRQQGRLSGRGLPAARRGDADPSAVHARTKPDRLLRAQHRGRQCGRDEPNPGRRAHSGLLPARETFVGRPAGDPLRPGDGTVRTNDAQNLRRLQRRKPRKGAAAVRRCRGAGSGPKLRADHRLPRQGVDSGRQRLALLLDAAFRRGRPMGHAPGGQADPFVRRQGLRTEHHGAEGGARSAAVPFRLPDLRRLLHGQHRNALRPAFGHRLHRGVALRGHGRRIPLRPDRPCSKRDRSRTGSRKPAGSSGTSTKTNTRARPGKSSRAASHWPSRRSWTRWRR